MLLFVEATPEESNVMAKKTVYLTAGVEAWELPNAMLLAEHSQLPEIPKRILKARAKGHYLPPEEECEVEPFEIGSKRYWYYRMAYVGHRYMDLYVECRRRKLDVPYLGGHFCTLPNRYWGDYQPTEADRQQSIGYLAMAGYDLLKFKDEPCESSTLASLQLA